MILFFWGGGEAEFCSLLSGLSLSHTCEVKLKPSRGFFFRDLRKFLAHTGIRTIRLRL